MAVSCTPPVGKFNTRIDEIMVALNYEQERARGIPDERFPAAARKRDVRKQTDAAADADRFSRPAGFELQPLPGSELPSAIYLLIIAAYGWMLGAAWYAFGSEAGTDWVLTMATVLTLVVFGIVLAMRKTAKPLLPKPPRNETAKRLQVATAHMETATGSLPAWHAWLEVLLIPMALAAAATLIGAAYLAS
jgi:hypothetical protein